MSVAPAVVTGAPGWLGTRLVSALAQGLEDVPALKQANPDRLIRCLVHHAQKASLLRDIRGRIEIVQGDLNDPGSLARLFEGMDQAVVFHGAGVIHPRRVAEFYSVNTLGTQNILNMAVKTGARRFIHVSSSSPLGTNPDRNQVFDESSPYNPYMNYGKSKKLAEDIVNREAQARRIETVIARAPWYYGPGQPPRQTKFFTMVKNGTVPLVGDGNNLRSMAYVDNLCQGLILCEKVPQAAGKTYWIADKEPYTMNRIMETIERVMEKAFQIPVARRQRKFPGIVSEIAFCADKLIQGFGWYQQDIHVLSEMNKNIACSIANAEKELGYEPKIELEEGIKRSIQWLIDQGVSI